MRSISRSAGAVSQGQVGAGHRGVTGRGEFRLGSAAVGAVGTGIGAGVRERAVACSRRGSGQAGSGRQRRAAKRRMGGVL